MNLDTYRQLRSQAVRLTRSDAEAEDLVQDVLVVALEAARSDLPWLSGVLQRQAAMHVRTGVRRRRREAVADDVDEERQALASEIHPERGTHAADAFLQRLPPAARRVALLALHGLDADEIRWIVTLSPAAFRQRLTSIRKVLGALPAPLHAEALALAYVRDPVRCVDLQFGLVRRALKAALHGMPGLATHDVDGHLLVIRSGAHTSAPRGNDQAGSHQRRTPMLQDCKVGAIVFFVRNLERTVDFYRDTLGLPVDAVDGHDGPFGVAEVGELVLVFIPREVPIGQSPVVVFGLDGGIDDYAAALAAKGVEIVVPVSESPDGGLSLDFVDPDRNMLSLHQPADAPRRR